MIRQKAKPAKTKGAALLMVLAVMVVLIMIIAGTLAVVSAAHKRNIMKYEESQAYYTARSGLDAFWNVLMSDSVHTDNTGVAKTVNATNKSQGLLIQEAIIGVLSENPTTGAVTYNCTNSLEVLKSDHSNANKSYLEFEMDLSQLNNVAAAEGGFGDGKASVKVQLLGLVFDDGASGIDRNTVSTTTADLKAGSKQAQYIKECRIKVSCTVTDTLNNGSTTVSVELSPYVNERSAGSGTVSTGSAAFDNGTIFGGLVSAAGQSWGNDTNIVGSVMVNGDVTATVSKHIYLKADENVVINGEFNKTNSAEGHMFVKPVMPKATTGKEHPYVYVQNTFYTSNQTELGDKTAGTYSGMVDLICSGMTIKNNGLPKIYGNTYIDGPLKINFSPISINDTYFDGNMFISDREEVNPSSGFTNLKDGGIDAHNKTYLGIFKPVKWGVGSNEKVRPYYTDGTNYYFDFRDDSNKLFKLIKDAGGDFSKFCTGTIYYYYNDDSSIAGGQGFEGAWEFEALSKVIKEATNPSHPNIIYKYSGDPDNPKGAEIALGGDLSKVKLVGTKNDNLKYICKLEGASTFLEGATVYPTTLTYNDPDKNTSYKFYMSLPVDDTTRTTAENADPLKASKLVPTLLSEYSEYLSINIPKTYTYSELVTPPAADPLNPENLWVSGATKFDFLKADRSGVIGPITYWDPYSGALGAPVSTYKWYEALGAVANNLNAYATYTPNQQLKLVSNILNAVYKCDASGNPDLTQNNVFFVDPALACAENKSIIFNNFDSVTSLNQTATEAKGLTVETVSPMNGGTKEIDTSGGDVVVILQAGTYNNNPTIKVTGSGYAYFLLSGNYNFDNIKIVDTFYDTSSLLSTQKYVLSSNKSGYVNINSPQIMVYADAGTKINCSNNCRLCAYFYGPGADISLAMSFGKNYTVLYNHSKQYAGQELNNVGFDIVGSLFMKEITGSNMMTSTYVPVDNTRTTPGAPTIKWTQYKYSNSDIITS